VSLRDGHTTLVNSVLTSLMYSTALFIVLYSLASAPFSGMMSEGQERLGIIFYKIFPFLKALRGLFDYYEVIIRLSSTPVKHRENLTFSVKRLENKQQNFTLHAIRCPLYIKILHCSCVGLDIFFARSNFTTH
jgi:hypothetical protein